MAWPEQAARERMAMRRRACFRMTQGNITEAADGLLEAAATVAKRLLL